MDMSEIKGGQKLRVTGVIGCVAGCIGTCTYIDRCRGLVALEFKISRAGLHSCQGHCKELHGYWCAPHLLEPVEEGVVDNNTPCAPPPVDVHIARLEDVVETLFKIGVSRQDMLELFNDITKRHFAEKQLRDKIVTIKDKVTKCQN